DHQGGAVGDLWPGPAGLYVSDAAGACRAAAPRRRAAEVARAMISVDRRYANHLGKAHSLQLCPDEPVPPRRRLLAPPEGAGDRPRVTQRCMPATTRGFRAAIRRGRFPVLSL